MSASVFGSWTASSHNLVNISLLLTFVFTLFILLSVGFLFAVTALKARREHGILPKSLPWSGRYNELLASFRANVRGATESAKLFTQGYYKYSKEGKIYVVPTWTKGPQVIVPPSMINWLAHQPSDVLNAKDCTFENMQFKYTVHHPEITHNDMLDLLIKRDLTRTIGTLNDEISEELELGMEDLFGTDTDSWKEVGVWDSMITTVARTANRVFVGPELCRNKVYLKSCSDWTRDIQVSGAILHMFPKFMKSAISWFATIPNRRDTRINMKHSVPLVAQRIQDMTEKLNNPSSQYEEPNDLLSWMVRESFKRSTPSERTPEALAYRLLLLNFAAVSTSTIGATNAVLDIISAPDALQIMAALREEAQRVLDEHGGVWTKAAVSKLYRIDSVLRESARVSGVGGTGLARRVRPENGIVLQDGTWVPKGATVGVAQGGIHFDEEYYDHPNVFDAFRFSRAREEKLGDAAPWEAPKNEDLVTTSPHFLAFSYGSHACPGRFFAANQLKLIVAHLVLNYDIQPLPFRPANTPLGDVMIPPVKVTMQIRRRATKA